MIETRHLAHVLALARHRHFGRAAQEVFLTQSALSRSIATLEHQLGVRLFDRGREGVKPTPFGELLIQRARGIATDLHDLVHEMELLKGREVGALTVGLAPYPSVLSGQTAIARLLASHPRIRCRVQVTRFGRITTAVAEGDLDLGLAELHDAAERSDVETELVVTRPLSFFCRPDHDLAARNDVETDDLMAYPWATTRAPRRMNAFLPQEVDRAGFWDHSTGEFVPAIETDIIAGVAELVSSSDALMVGTTTVVEQELASGRLRRVRYEAPWLRFNYGFISRPTRTLPPVAEEFMRLVRSIEEELDERENRLLAQFG